MYKNAHLQNIPPGPKLGMEETEELVSRSQSWPVRQEKNGYLWFFNGDGLKYVGPKQTFPQVKASSSRGHLRWPLHQVGQFYLRIKPLDTKLYIQRYFNLWRYHKGLQKQDRTWIFIWLQAFMQPTLKLYFNKHQMNHKSTSISDQDWGNLLWLRLGAVHLCSTTQYCRGSVPQEY